MSIVLHTAPQPSLPTFTVTDRLLFPLCFLCGVGVPCIRCTETDGNVISQLCANNTSFFFNESTYIPSTSSHSLLEERILNFIQTVKSGEILTILSHSWFTMVPCQVNIQSKSGVFILSHCLVQNTDFMVPVHFSRSPPSPFPRPWACTSIAGRGREEVLLQVSGHDGEEIDQLG